MVRKQFTHVYDDIISVENLLSAWEEFRKGKRQKVDVQEFQRNLFQNISALHNELKMQTYTHGGYEAFSVSDPKSRNIHKASVRDRVVHHALYQALAPFFESVYISDSYSCRQGKGTHLAINRFQNFARKVSMHHTRTCWVLKCDVKKCFASVDHTVLLVILERHIADEKLLSLLGKVVGSFHSIKYEKGLPLGNLTSQLLINVYLNELDQYAKHTLKAKYYIRYADDFVFLSTNRVWLESLIPRVASFLSDHLKFTLHPDKIFLKNSTEGVDFLGWLYLPECRVLRTTTKRRMYRRVREAEGKEEVVASYKGLLAHGNGWKLRQKLDSLIPEK